MKDYFKLLRFIRGQEKLFIPAVFFMFLSALFESAQLSLMVPMADRIFTNKQIILPNDVPSFIRNIVDHLNTIDQQTLYTYAPILILGLILIKNLVSFIYDLIMNDISQRIMRDIRYRLYSTIQNLSLDYFSKKRSGELISRITNDVQIIENAVSYAVTDMFRQSFMIIIYVYIVFTIHYKAALILFFLIPLIGLPMALIGKKLKKLSKSSQEKMADINSLLLETISGIRVVKAFCMEQYETNRFMKQNREFYKLKMKSIKRLLLISPITELMGASFGIFIFWVLGRQVLNGEVSFGIFIWFMGSILSTISPIKKLANVNAITQQALAANTRIYEVLETKPTVQEKSSALDLPQIKKGISLQNISFGYGEDYGEVLQGINLEIKAGELIAIVGPTGSGKSTLANLIPRFYDPTSGNVLIDGLNLRDVSLKSLLSQIGIVSQETILFNDSVGANIAYGHLEASPTQIEDAAQKAYAHQFIMKMPQKYETKIGDRGFRLSGGERQRIAIARAILKNPPILILDEATSQLDSESERFVQDALDELMKGRTVICIAHRFSTIFNADKILVLDHGKIVGLGRHDELLKNCPLYKRLYQTQFQLQNSASELAV